MKNAPKQVANSMDAVSMKKTLHGFGISLAGAALAGFVLLIPEVNDYIALGEVINWRPALVAVWGAFSSGLVNMVREYVKGA